MAHDQEVMGSNPGILYWMDVSNLLAIIKEENLKIKAAKWGTPKKYFKKKFITVGSAKWVKGIECTSFNKYQITISYIKCV